MPDGWAVREGGREGKKRVGEREGGMEGRERDGGREGGMEGKDGGRRLSC